MSAILVANVTVNGSVTVQGPYANVQYMNATSLSSLLTFSAATGLPIGASNVAGGYYHTAVLLANGTVRTFGYNNNGQLGVNDTAVRPTPVQVFAISSSAIAVATGVYHTAVLLANGTVQTFGYNNKGQLGVNDTANRSTPVQVWAISSSAIAVACGGYHTSVLLANGTVQTFGYNVYGQLGVNDTTLRNTPVQVFAISSSAIAVAGGRFHTAVLLSNGTVRTFGANGNGQLGVNDTANRPTPVQVWAISSSAIAVACGNYHTAVLLANGTVQTFGYNSNGQLGVNDTTQRNTPVQVFAISSSAIAVACGSIHSAVLLANGTVQTFGTNGNGGQLGVNDTASRSTPVQVWAISSSAFAVACGRFHTAVLLSNGTVQTFGLNNNGQLGVNDTANRSTPVQVLNIPATGFLFSFNGPVFNGPLGIGLAPSVYQLDMASDTARKLSTSTWFTGSDERIKNNIETANLARCAEIVDSLDLKYFEWISNVGSTDQHSLGWIAQDVQQFFPKSVTTGSGYDLDDFHTLNSDQLIKVLYGAIKQTLIEYFPRTE